MNIATLLRVAQQFSEKAKKKGQHGTNLTQSEWNALQKSYPQPLSQWYKELMTKGNIIGIECVYHKEHQMTIASYTFIQQETFDAYPGVEWAPHGFICFGISPFGSDPYFIQLSENPTIMQCYHDDVYPTGAECVTHNLVEFFQQAIID